MKKVLVTGKNGYIGIKFKEWIKENNSNIEVSFVSLKDIKWEKEDFSKYDVLLHLAGIAHNSTNKKLETMYYDINRDLTFAVAKKAKDEGIKHFIFMSSIIVFGNPVEGKISEKTKTYPENFYGDSKLQAENLVLELNSNNFKVSIIRPPMVYGNNSKGNYSTLKKYSKYLFLTPDFPNERSVININNLCNFIHNIIIEKPEKIYFHPQDKSYMNTSEVISKFNNIGIKTTLFNPLIRIIMKRSNLLKKMFGNLTYDTEISDFNLNYHNSIEDKGFER